MIHVDPYSLPSQSTVPPRVVSRSTTSGRRSGPTCRSRWTRFLTVLRSGHDLEQHPATLTDTAEPVDRIVGIADPRRDPPGEAPVHLRHVVGRHPARVKQALDHRGVVLDHVPERVRPEGRQAVRVGAVDADLVRNSHAPDAKCTDTSRSREEPIVSRSLREKPGIVVGGDHTFVRSVRHARGRALSLAEAPRPPARPSDPVDGVRPGPSSDRAHRFVHCGRRWRPGAGARCAR